MRELQTLPCDGPGTAPARPVPDARAEVLPAEPLPAETLRTETSPAETLSARLRRETAAAHAAVEAAAGLPARVTDIAAYTACLEKFFRLFAPLEAELAGFGEWAGIGIDLAARHRTADLAADLAALGRAVPPPVAGPPPANFPQALGMLYVLEGSTLGGKILAAAFARQLGPGIAAASRFFSPARPAAGWAEFRAALDRYGAANPAACPQVIAGALASFGRFAAGLA